MRNPAFLCIAFLIFSCHQTDKTKTLSVNSKDSSASNSVQKEAPVSDDSLISNLTDQVLGCLKATDFNCLADFVHPTAKLRFSPYVNVDSTSGRSFTKDELKALSGSNKKLNWGPYDAGEENIVMTPKEYISAFAFEDDFLKSPQKTFNKVTNRGTLPNNIPDAYPGDKFVELYLPGKDPKFDGMDWSSLNLVFRKIEGRFYLVGIIHGAWTT